VDAKVDSKKSCKTCKTCGVVLLPVKKGEHPVGWCPPRGSERPGSRSGRRLLCYRCRNRRPRDRFARAAAKAKKRRLSWEIPFASWSTLVSAPCYWCDGKLDEVGSGLDRLDDLRGYEIDNVVPACGSCNVLRHNNGLSPIAMAGCASTLRALYDRMDLERNLKRERKAQRAHCGPLLADMARNAFLAARAAQVA
jgi:hypothetical protein